jgi:hypothetical protein
MKINFVRALIAIGIAALIAYAFYTYYEGKNNLLLTSGSFISLSITLLWVLSIDLKQPRTTTVVRTVSGVFFTLFLITNVLFSFFNFENSVYVIVNGITFLLYVLISYSIARGKQ